MEAIALMIAAFKKLGMDKNLIMHTTIAVEAFDDINHMLADERVEREWICDYAFEPRQIRLTKSNQIASHR